MQFIFFLFYVECHIYYIGELTLISLLLLNDYFYLMIYFNCKFMLIWVQTQLSAQSSFQKLIFDKSSQKTRKIRYHITQFFSSFVQFCCISLLCAKNFVRDCRYYVRLEHLQKIKMKTKLNRPKIAKETSSGSTRLFQRTSPTT